MPTKNNLHINGFKTRQEIALQFFVSTKTLGKKLKAKDIELPPGMVSLRWQKKIYEALGYPSGTMKGEYDHI